MDAGGMVRCSYCGRSAPVPDPRAANLDYLFKDVQQPPEEEAPRRRRRRPKRPPAAPGRPKRFNPVDVILKLCYAAALVIIVVVVARKFVVPRVQPGQPPHRSTASADAGEAVAEIPAAPIHVPTTAMGLMRETKLIGLHVASVPSGASVFCAPESQCPNYGRIHQIPGASKLRTNGELPKIADGTYVIEVVFPWNDPNLSDPNLGNYARFLEFRRAIERAPEDQRQVLLEEYFVPDEASAVLVDQTEDQIYLVRQYRGIVVRQGQSNGVRALFLPRFPSSDPRSFQIEPLLDGYLPAAKSYRFNESHVRAELEFHRVPSDQMVPLMEVLSRIGVVPFRTLDRRVQLFKIGLHDGSFSARVIREAAP